LGLVEWNSVLLCVTLCNVFTYKKRNYFTEFHGEKKERHREIIPLWNSVLLGVTPCNKRLFHRETQRKDGATQRKELTKTKLGVSMEFNEITREIIGAAIEVHKQLGPGMLESAYEECLSYELTSRGFSVERQKPVPVVYKEVKLECGYRIDILVNGTVVVELKSVDALAPIHEAQILTYMRFAKKKIGLLINFNVTVLKNGIKRYVF